MVLDNERIVRCPGGPPSEPWKVTHTFFQCDRIIVKTVDGDVPYRVVQQPGKFVLKDGKPFTLCTEADVKNAVPCEVYWYFDIDLES